MAEILALFAQGGWLLVLMKGVLPALSLFYCCIGFGSKLRSIPEWDLCFGLGLSLLGALLLPLTALGLGSFSLFLIPVGWFFLWQERDSIRWFSRDIWFWLWMAVFVLVQLLFLLPITDTDTLYYQLSIPKQIWMQNGLLGGELRPNGSRPLPFHLLLSLLFGLGSVNAVLSFCSLIAVSAMLSLGQRLEANSRWIVFLLCVGSFSFWEQMTVVANNIVVGFLLWLAWCIKDEQKSQQGSLGLLLGAAVAIKLTAVGIGAAIWLVSRQTWRRKVIEVFCGAPVLLMWWLRNIVEGQHFLFPYRGWQLDIPFVYLEKYGLGREPIDLLLLPWNIVMRAEIDSLQYLGQLSPIFLLSPFLVWRWVRGQRWREAFVLCSGFLFWMMGPHWIRHLFPMWFVFIAQFSRSLPWSPLGMRVLVGFLFLLGLKGNLWAFTEKQLLRLEQEQALIPGYQAMMWINQHTGEQDKTALLFAWSGAMLERPFVLGSVEDHTPVRHWFLTRGDSAIRDLSAEGVSYIVVGPHRFLQQAYPFVAKDTFQKEFLNPVRQMEQLLHRDARLLVQFDGYEIYKIIPE